MKVHLKTFGCRANHYDSERVRALVLSAGHEIVDEPTKADVAVVNSCAVTSEAERDARKAVRRAASVNSRVRTIVMGCAAALPASRRALAELPNVSHVIGGAALDEIAQALDAGHPEQREGSVVAQLQIPRFARNDVSQSQDSVRAVLRIQDGCDEHCTFCATTIARGANRSRSADELVQEAQRLAEHHPEIVITGTHIGSYGADIGSSLGALMQTLVVRVAHVRFRLSSIEATEIDDALFELFVSDPRRVAPHLHAPLQSGSDRVLKRMGRHWYTARTYAERVERLAARMPILGLGADVIVGFPGETEDDFAATQALIERLPFTYLHIFSYSPRPGTAAARLGAPVAMAEVHRRSRALRHLAQTKGNDYLRRRSGGTADAIVITSGPNAEAITGDYLTLPVLGMKRPRGERFVAEIRTEGEKQVLY